MTRAVSRGSMVIGAAGDVDPDRFATSVGRRFGALRPGAAPRAALPRPEIPDAPRVTLVDKPERTQTQIFIGQPAIAWNHPDFLPLIVATNAFGGTFTARLMNEVRVKRGLSYGASARLGQGRGPRALQVYVFPAIERTAETLGLVSDLWRTWVDEGLTDEELRFSRENLASSSVFDRVTPEDRLDMRVALLVCGMDADYADTLAERLRAITDEEVRFAMARHLTTTGLTVTLLATADQLAAQRATAWPPSLTAINTIPFDAY